MYTLCNHCSHQDKEHFHLPSPLPSHPFLVDSPSPPKATPVLIPVSVGLVLPVSELHTHGFRLALLLFPYKWRGESRAIWGRAVVRGCQLREQKAQRRLYTASFSATPAAGLHARITGLLPGQPCSQPPHSTDPLSPWEAFPDPPAAVCSPCPELSFNTLNAVVMKSLVVLLLFNTCVPHARSGVSWSHHMPRCSLLQCLHIFSKDSLND